MNPEDGGGPATEGGRAAVGPVPRDGAVTEIIGNILMIGVTVLLATALAYSLTSMSAATDRVHADLVVEDGADLEVRHAGGEAVPVDGPRFVLTVDGSEQRHPLSDFSSDVSGGSSSLWEIGERVCLSCRVGGTIETITFVAAEQVILDWDRNT